MKALVCSAIGSLDNLSVQEVADPIPAGDEVVVDVVAAALNFPDILLVAGKYQIQPEVPFVAGGEAAGVVSSVGRDVTALKPGDRVALVGSVGAFAEQALKKEHELIRIPDHMEFEIAAGFCVAYGTAYYALKQCGGIRSGQTVLVLGAAGGVGFAAVDISGALGANVIAAASNDEKLAICRQQGADHTINYGHEPLKERVKELTAGAGVDVVIDPVGGELSESALRATGWDGRFLVVGFAAGEIPQIPLNLPLLKNCSIQGVFFGAWAQRDVSAYLKNYAELFELLETRRLHPLVSERFKLDDYAAAYQTLSERRALGKVILELRS